MDGPHRPGGDPAVCFARWKFSSGEVVRILNVVVLRVVFPFLFVSFL